MQPFSTPWKYQKTIRCSDVLRGVEKGCIGNEWVEEKNIVRKVINFEEFRLVCKFCPIFYLFIVFQNSLKIKFDESLVHCISPSHPLTSIGLQFRSIKESSNPNLLI